MNTAMPFTAFFAGVFALFFVRLAFVVIRLRRSNRVALGDGSVKELEGAIRAHGNFAEYVPLGLILIGLLESNGLHPAFLGAAGGLFALGRVLHANALHRGDLNLRVRGMMLTFGMLVTMAIINIAFAAKTWLGL
jgi:uncharacterized membrane protein YecN with MAPEG domain